MEVDKEQLSGVYLVIDPSMEEEQLLDKTARALKGGVGIIQVWNHWPQDYDLADKKRLISKITDIAAGYDVPVLINDDWKLLKNTNLDGVHFDKQPENYDQIEKEIGREFIAGITCSNNLEVIRWAEEYDFDYVSFCAMFPSPSVESCEIVSPRTVRKAREITNMPLFLSGGITPDKIDDLKDLDYQGVAVISGIMKSESPKKRTKEFNRLLESRK